jgi:hypothetical protein
MRLYGNGRGVIINPCYRRTSVLRTLMANFKDPVEEDREESCKVIYLEGERDSYSAEEL